MLPQASRELRASTLALLAAQGCHSQTASWKVRLRPIRPSGPQVRGWVMLTEAREALCFKSAQLAARQTRTPRHGMSVGIVSQ